MKKLLLLTLLFCISVCGFTQTTALLKNQKDGWGTSYTYVGEVKNNKPDGLGVAIYNNNTAMYYVGNFANGQFSGKGTLVFTHKGFLTGNWKNGKLNGKGATLNKEKSLFVGNFFDGKKTGKGTLIYKDNGFITGEFANDQFSGRNIYISSTANNINDNIYYASKKNGTGYQYDVENKKLFEGEWSNGDWVASRTAAYRSFLKDPDFFGEKTSNQILMGIIDPVSRLLSDSAFFYDLKKKKRYFGKYEKGFLVDGLTINDDSTRFIGHIDTKGASGYCHYLKMDDIYYEGNYTNDRLNGPNSLTIDILKGTVYYGNSIDGYFNGKGYFIDKDMALYVGDFVKGKFTGNGYRLGSEGSMIKGTFEDGYPVKVNSITDADGKAMKLNPSGMPEAITFLREQYKKGFEVIKGKIELDFETYLDDPDYLFDYANVGLYELPGAQRNYAVQDYVGLDAYLSLYTKTSDIDRAKAKYRELCEQMGKISVKKDRNSPAVKLESDFKDITSYSDYSKYYFPGEGGSNDFHVCVVFLKVKEDDYRVFVTMGNEELVDYWVYGDY